jgi:hypothetical protein
VELGELVALNVPTAPGKGQSCDWTKCRADHPSKLTYPANGTVTRGSGFRGTLEWIGSQPWLNGNHGVPTKPIYLANGKIKRNRDGTEFTEYRWEAHHLIPIEQMGKTSTLKKNAELSGWDINSAVNGMGLPGDEMDIAIHHLQLHEGSHCGKYTNPVKNALTQIEQDFENMCHGKTDTSMQLMLNLELDALSRRAEQKILAIRQGSGTGCWELHTTSLAKYKKVLITYAQRKALNATLPPNKR